MLRTALSATRPSRAIAGRSIAPVVRIACCTVSAPGRPCPRASEAFSFPGRPCSRFPAGYTPGHERIRLAAHAEATGGGTLHSMCQQVPQGKMALRRLPQTGARAGEKEVRVQAVEKGRTGTTAARRLALAVQSSPIFSAAVGSQPTHRRTVLGIGSSGLEWLAANQTNELPLLRTPLLAPGRFRILNTPS